MIYQVHYYEASGKSKVELCEAKTPKDAIEIVKNKFENIRILQVTMEIKLYD